MHWARIFQDPTATNMQLYSSVVQGHGRAGRAGGTTPALGKFLWKETVGPEIECLPSQHEAPPPSGLRVVHPSRSFRTRGVQGGEKRPTPCAGASAGVLTVIRREREDGAPLRFLRVTSGKFLIISAPGLSHQQQMKTLASKLVQRIS